MAVQIVQMMMRSAGLYTVHQSAGGNSSWILKCVRGAIGKHLNMGSLKKEVNGFQMIQYH